MNINRDNYEEYFLLYADNELSRSDKEMVETFVNDNTDLKDEFLMIQRTVIHPDDNTELADKSFLLKKETGFITKNNYEEVFVLYYDDELTEKQKKETKNFAEQNTGFKKEFELFGKSKLIPDSVIYQGKKYLYRKEKYAKVIPLPLLKYLATAVLIGFGLWITIPYFHKTTKDNSTWISINNTAKSVTEGIRQDSTSNIKDLLQQEKTNIASNNKQAIKNETEVKKLNHTNSQSGEELAATEDLKPELEIVKSDPVTIQLPLHLQSVISKKVSPLLTINKRVKDSLQSVASINLENKINSGDVNNIPDQTMNDFTVDNENYVFYNVTEEEFRRSKVGGFLKKIKRVVERSNPIARLITGYEE